MQPSASSVTKALPSFSGGTGVNKALNNWKSWRLTLATAISGYTSACVDLKKACISPPGELRKRQRIEKALLAIDAELSSLELEEAALCRARTSLVAARNASESLVPINSLPPEILTRVFLATQCTSRDWYDSEELPPAQLLVGICSYWRQLALSIPSLWTDMNITTCQRSYNYATLLFHRSNHLPICLNIFEPEELEANNRWAWENSGPPSELLTETSKRIQALDIYSQADSNEKTNTVLKYWLDNCSAGTTKTLRIFGCSGPLPHTQLEWEFYLSSVEHAESILHSISTLELHSFTIPWQSVAYHQLVELRLSFRPGGGAQVSVSQLAHILNSSPGLAKLQLSGLNVTSSDGWDVTNAVRLAQLEFLYLGVSSSGGSELLFSLIELSSCLNNLSIYLCFMDLLHETPGSMVCLAQEFLRNTRTTTLVCAEFVTFTSPRRALSIASAIPSLENLILRYANYLDTDEPEVIGPEHSPSIEDESRKTTAPTLPHLFMAASRVNLKSLKNIVSKYGFRIIHLDRCYTEGYSNASEHAEQLRNSLLDIFPDIICTVSSTDTTSKWPCRALFEERVCRNN